MKVKRWHEPKVYTIREAVVRLLMGSMDGQGFNQGVVEELVNKTDELITVVSEMFEVMVDKGVMDEEKALGMLEGYEKVMDGDGSGRIAR